VNEMSNGLLFERMKSEKRNKNLFEERDEAIEQKHNFSGVKNHG